MPRVSGESELNAFRDFWSGSKTVELLQEHGGKLRINWCVGVGKSYNIDDTTSAAIFGGVYDLVIVLQPTRRLINERRWIIRPPKDIKIVNLKPRPWKRCGALNQEWNIYEQNDLGALGRRELCGQCARLKGCYWPRQYGKALKGVNVVYATHAHLKRSSGFIRQLIQWTGAQRALVLIDEVDFVMSSFQRRIHRHDLERFIQAIEATPATKMNRKWVYTARLLLTAQTDDLRCGDWRFPGFSPDWAVTVQNAGRAKHNDFKFIGYGMRAFCRSPFESRERTTNGDIQFTSRPFIGCDFVVYSGTAHPELLRYRLGTEFVSPFEETTFKHPGTHWYNIASGIGTRRHFPNNANQILDFFAKLIAKRLAAGKRPLLIAKKCFLVQCAKGIEERLHVLGYPDARIVYRDLAKTDLTDPNVVPLINFGIIGTNLYEHFDCAYCLCGYYVNERILDSTVQDLLAADFYIPLTITMTGIPRRRRAGVREYEHRHYDVHKLAQLALDQKEIDVVLQAAGRVRPYTRPREIVLFQCAAIPGVTLTREFSSLAEARLYFGISNQREQGRDENALKIQAAKQCGNSQSQVVRQTGLSLSTVKRYWN